jgi:hypothetical protein
MVRLRMFWVMTRSHSRANLETSSTSGCYLTVLRGDLIIQKSIRLIFSIADLQNEEENFEGEEEEGNASAETGEPSYPLRCSITVTKVCAYTHSLLLLRRL